MTPVGEQLRGWRQRRRMSQLDLACDADISTRHLSFLETGRSRPSRDMVVHLAERLDIPLRERNRLLVAAGFAPAFPERALDDPAMDPARKAIDQVLTGHEPFPALAVDRHWTLVAANRMVEPMMAGAAPKLLEPPINVLRLSLHPDGVAPRIVNYTELREHIVNRLRRLADMTADPVLVDLLEELLDYPEPDGADDPAGARVADPAAIVVPFQLRSEAGVLSFFSTMTVFGSPLDVTLSELAIEAFYPADAQTGEILRAMESA